MTKSFLTILAFLIGSLAWAQKPVEPPHGDVTPPPLPAEGEKKVEPTPGHQKSTVPDPAKGKRKRPPVKPPTPEPTAPDQPQDGIHH